MTDANLMDANCVHGVVWYECDQCEDPTEEEMAQMWQEAAEQELGE